MGARRPSFDEFEPGAIWSLSVLVGDNLHNIAIVQLIIKRHYFIVDAGASALIAQRRVDMVGEINGSGFVGQVNDVALGSENENAIFENINFGAFQKSVVVFCFF